LIDVVPEKNIFAVCISNQLNCFDLQTGALTGKTVVLPKDSFDYISIGKSASEILCNAGANNFSVNWIDGEIKILPEKENIKTYPSYICSIQKYAAVTNTFNSPNTEINVVINKGLAINSKGQKLDFNVGTTAKYIGIGFLADEENFLFQLGGEIMVVNIKTKKVGRLYEGILGIIKNKRYEIK